ncbi:enolase C-terminal domain-like protein [Halarchaeum nitratireducens]|uniref:gluconate dehydratase n=1 Tax=Halarchaeum nitratireducens TaxID=489913 RepID=A0A830GEX6_9EURY|nr:enolase C-terminal domain-like protein [Halarchaeum nitratireducens]GGN24669.1 L-rhamnonate dehydratase [Halarchaeum nitratireducens]
MEITEIRTTDVSTDSWGEFVEFPLVTVMSGYEEYNNADGDNPQARRKWMGPVGDVVVEVETDAGITGYGAGNWATGAISTIVEETLSKLVVGEDPADRERLWDMMYRATIPFGRKGAAIEAISAVDLALWDIAGKEAGKPVYELLGGKTKDEIPAYASNLHPVDYEKLASEAQQYAEAGFEAMKLRFRYGPEAGRKGMKENEAIVETVRDAVGDEIAIAGDAYMGWSVRYAKKMLDRLEPYDMEWVEEPVIPDDIDGYAEVREAAPMPISGGEHEFTRWGHKELLERDALDILQPDVHRCGGLTELLKIDSMASAHDVPVIPHSGTNPHLHFIAASTNAPMAEYFPIPEWYEERQNEEKESTYADAIYANPPNAENGAIPVPEGPGTNSELNREALEHFRVE